MTGQPEVKAVLFGYRMGIVSNVTYAPFLAWA